MMESTMKDEVRGCGESKRNPNTHNNRTYCTEPNFDFSNSDVNREVSFCCYCGAKLDVGARFCKNCGQPISNASSHTSESEDKNKEQAAHKESMYGNPSQRKTVYEGYIHKCPNCGEVLKAFVAVCPSCGYEIRDTKSTNSVKEFAMKLERIEAEKMPSFEEKNSVMKMVFGKDFNKDDEAEEAQNRFDEQKTKEKVTLIINYSVPNTKEDILEFMILATSNINVKNGVDDEVTKAWIAKLDQVYQRAEISMGNSSDFMQIKSIYDKKKSEIKAKKIKIVLCFIGFYAILFFMLGIYWNPVATIFICIGIIFSIILIVILFKKKK